MVARSCERTSPSTSLRAAVDGGGATWVSAGRAWTGGRASAEVVGAFLAQAKRVTAAETAVRATTNRRAIMDGFLLDGGNGVVITPIPNYIVVRYNSAMPNASLKETDYLRLARFRQALRRFLRFSEEAA